MLLAKAGTRDRRLFERLFELRSSRRRAATWSSESAAEVMMAQPNRLCRGRPGKAIKFIGRAGNGKGSMARWRRPGGPQGRAAQNSLPKHTVVGRLPGGAPGTAGQRQSGPNLGPNLRRTGPERRARSRTGPTEYRRKPAYICTT